MKVRICLVEGEQDDMTDALPAIGAAQKKVNNNVQVSKHPIGYAEFATEEQAASSILQVFVGPYHRYAATEDVGSPHIVILSTVVRGPDVEHSGPAIAELLQKREPNIKIVVFDREAKNVFVRARWDHSSHGQVRIAVNEDALTDVLVELFQSQSFQ